jgi:hypothetical protein
MTAISMHPQCSRRVHEQGRRGLGTSSAHGFGETVQHTVIGAAGVKRMANAAFCYEDDARARLSPPPRGAWAWRARQAGELHSSVQGSKAAIEAGPDTTIRDFGATFIGPVTIAGPHERGK